MITISGWSFVLFAICYLTSASYTFLSSILIMIQQNRIPKWTGIPLFALSLGALFYFVLGVIMK